MVASLERHLFLPLGEACVSRPGTAAELQLGRSFWAVAKEFHKEDHVYRERTVLKGGADDRAESNTSR